MAGGTPAQLIVRFVATGFKQNPFRGRSTASETMNKKTRQIKMSGIHGAAHIRWPTVIRFGTGTSQPLRVHTVTTSRIFDINAL